VAPPRSGVMRRPRIYYGWYIVLAGFLGNITAGGIQSFTFGVIFKPMADALGWGRGPLAAGLAVRQIGGAFIAPLFGVWIDRYGPRWVMFGSALVGGIATILVSQVTQLWQFYIVYGIAGALTLTGVGELIVASVIPKWFIRDRGKALAWGTMGNPAAGTLVAPVLAVIIATWGWAAGWWFLGLLILFLAVPASFIMRRQPEDMGLLPDGDPPEPAGVEGSGRSVSTRRVEAIWTLGEASRASAFWLLLVSLSMGGMAVAGVVIHEFSVLTDRGLSAVIATAVLATHSFCGLSGRVLWGTLADRFPVRYLMGGVFLGSALGLVILMFVRTAPMAFAFAIVYGIAVGGNSVLNPMIWANYFGRGFVGTIRGVTMPAQLVALSLGPVLAGFIFDWTGSYMIPFAVFVCTYTAGGVLVLVTKPPMKTLAATEAPALLRV
jgi:MFS family permease